jgi:hypothetical protein
MFTCCRSRALYRSADIRAQTSLWLLGREVTGGASRLPVWEVQRSWTNNRRSVVSQRERQPVVKMRSTYNTLREEVIRPAPAACNVSYLAVKPYLTLDVIRMLPG